MIAVGQYLISSSGAHLEKLVPFLLRIFLSLPFLSWQHHAHAQVQQLAYRLCSMLTEISICVPSSLFVISRTILLLFRQLTFVVKELQVLRFYIIIIT